MEKLQNFGWELNPKKIVDRKKYPKLQLTGYDNWRKSDWTVSKWKL